MVSMRTLNRYVLHMIIPAFLAAIAVFSLLLELIDLFSNLVKYIQNDATLGQVFRILALYFPRCLSYSIAPSLLFASAFSFGSLRNTNELIVIHGSGVSLVSFAVPVMVFAVILSIGGFWFEDAVALPFLRQKKDLSRALLGQRVTQNNAEIALLNRKEGVVWTADYFNDTEKTLTGVTVVRRDEGGQFVERLDARKARWETDRWVFQDARKWAYSEKGVLEESFLPEVNSRFYDEPPASFRKGKKELDELTVAEAREYVRFLKSAGLPYRGGVAEYYERFSFSLTPVIVAMLSIGLGSRIRKNIVLSSLLISLSAATGYYVMRMITMLFARLDIISPFAGAVSPLAVFLVFGVLLFRTAHT